MLILEGANPLRAQDPWVPGVLQKQDGVTQSCMHGPEGLANSEMWNSGLLLSMINKKLY